MYYEVYYLSNKENGDWGSIGYRTKKEALAFAKKFINDYEKIEISKCKNDGSVIEIIK